MGSDGNKALCQGREPRSSRLVLQEGPRPRGERRLAAEETQARAAGSSSASEPRPLWEGGTRDGRDGRWYQEPQPRPEPLERDRPPYSEQLRNLALAAPTRKRQRSPDPKSITVESLDLNRPMKRVRPGELYRAASSPDRSAVMAVRRSPSPEARTFEIWDPERIHLLAAHDGVRHVEAQLEVKDLRKNVAAASLLLLDREGTVVHQQGFIAVSGLPENYGDLDTPEGFELVDLAPEFTPLERSTGFIDIPGSVSHNGARTLDSEYKLMARIAEYCDELGDDAPNSGRVIIASSYDACLSCQRVMATFVQDRMRETNQDFVINFYSNTENPAERMSHFYDPKEVFVQDHQGERRKLFMSRVDRFQNVVRPRRD